jgi:hypothetical protein
LEAADVIRFVLDKLSAGLGLFNEAVLQNVINVFGWMGTYLSLVGAICAIAGSAAYGAGATPGAIVAWIGVVIAGIGLAAALTKSVITHFRTSVAFLSALWNQDAKYQNELNARARQTGLQAGADTIQTISKGVSVGADVLTPVGAYNAMGQHAQEMVQGAVWGVEGGMIGTGIAAGGGAPAVSDATSSLMEAYNDEAPTREKQLRGDGPRGKEGWFKGRVHQVPHVLERKAMDLLDPSDGRSVGIAQAPASAPLAPASAHGHRVPIDTPATPKPASKGPARNVEGDLASNVAADPARKLAAEEFADRQAAFESRLEAGAKQGLLINTRIDTLRARLAIIFAPLAKLAGLLKKSPEKKEAKAAKKEAKRLAKVQKAAAKASKKNGSQAAPDQGELALTDDAASLPDAAEATDFLSKGTDLFSDVDSISGEVATGIEEDTRESVGK